MSKVFEREAKCGPGRLECNFNAVLVYVDEEPDQLED